MSYLKTLKKDGVVLVKDAWPEDEIKKNKDMSGCLFIKRKE